MDPVKDRHTVYTRQPEQDNTYRKETQPHLLPMLDAREKRRKVRKEIYKSKYHTVVEGHIEKLVVNESIVTIQRGRIGGIHTLTEDPFVRFDLFQHFSILNTSRVLHTLIKQGSNKGTQIRTCKQCKHYDQDKKDHQRSHEW